MSRAQAAAVLLVVLMAGLGLRLMPLGQEGLWLDEVFSAGFASLSLAEIPVAVLRFDVHPPGYYLQLGLWSLWSRTDEWLLLNSVFWSVLSIALAYHVVADRAGRAHGLVAALALALCGSEIYYATELRMYAMLSTVMLLAWHLTDRCLTAPTRGRYAALLLTLLVLSTLHSAAFILVGAVLGHLLLGHWHKVGRISLSRGVVAVWVLAALMLLPWLANASFRSLSHMVQPTWEVMAVTLGGWWFGYFPGLSAAHYQAGALVTVLLVVTVLVWGQARQRLVCLAYVVFPVVLVGVISVTLRPIWLDRTLAFCAPALVLALTLGGGRQPARWTAAAVAALLLMAVWAQIPQREQLPRKMQFREAADHILMARASGAKVQVHVPDNVRFWGMARYLAGPDWGSVLAIQDPQLVRGSSTWTRIYDKLGEGALQRLHLLPRQRDLAFDAGRLWIGPSPLPDDVVRAGYFLVDDMSALKRSRPCPQGDEVARHVFTGVTVFQCRQMSGLGRP